MSGGPRHASRIVGCVRGAALTLALGSCVAGGSAPDASTGRTGGQSGERPVDSSVDEAARPGDAAEAVDAWVVKDGVGAEVDRGPDLAARDAAEAFWPAPFVSECKPTPVGGRAQADGHHRAGEDCMQAGCHQGASPDAGAAFLFAGTVRRAGSLALYPSVEIAVKAGTSFISACSASNGNFWALAPDGRSLDWAKATARVRTANGESVMLPAPEAGCNTCHNPALLLTAP